jgi:ferritin-like metal-binding protein YciE
VEAIVRKAKSTQRKGLPVKKKSLQDLFNEEIEDLFDAENQIVMALPKVAKAAVAKELRSAFEEHLEQTKEHVSRLEQVFAAIGRDATRKKCEGMKGLLEEGDEIIKELEQSSVRDVGLIAAAQKVEHYEISGYGTAQTLAALLGYDKAVKLLQETLDEEKAADEKLTAIAESGINIEAAEGGENSAGTDKKKDQKTRTSGGPHQRASG